MSLHLLNITWDPFSTFLTIISFLLLYAIYKIVLYPLMRMRFYQKQGIPTYYFPLVGFYKDAITGLKEHGDLKYPVKMKPQTSPARLLVTNLGLELFILLFDPALIKEFALHHENHQKDIQFTGLISILLGKGLGTAEGEQWKNQRKILSSSFHFDFLRSCLPVIQNSAHKTLYDLRKSPLTRINIMKALQTATGDIFGRVFFGEQLNQYHFEGKPLTIALGELLNQLGDVNLSIVKLLLGTNFVKRGILPHHRRLMKKAKEFRQVCRDIIIERKKQLTSQTQEKEAKDMLENLLTYNIAGKMTVDEIIDQFTTFFSGGMDTSAHLVTMVMYYMDLYPEYKKEITEEIKQHYPYGKVVTMEDLSKLDFTMAVLKETLRTANPASGMVPRKAVRDYKLKEITIRKGDVVNIDFFYNNYNPEFFDEPEKYNPHRFLEKNSKAMDAYAFTPFSAGPRNCIGQHFALMQAKMLVAEFLTMYDYKVMEGYKLRMDFNAMYEPKDPVLVDLKVKDV